MKTLFQQSFNKDKSIEDYLPVFKKIGYPFRYTQLETIGAGTLIRIHPDVDSSYHILTIPWVRNISIGQKDAVKQLSDYPRLNLPKAMQKGNERERVEGMLKLVTSFNLYFLVILPRPLSGDLFWLDKYSTIPKENWALTYRKSPSILDRLHVVSFSSPTFLSLRDLKLQLNEIFKK